MNTVLSNQDVKDRLAHNVKVLLAKRGLSQMEVARRTGDSTMVINDIVHGRSNPSVASLLRLAEVLETTIDDLVSEPGKKAAPEIRRGRPKKVPA